MTAKKYTIIIWIISHLTYKGEKMQKFAVLKSSISPWFYMLNLGFIILLDLMNTDPIVIPSLFPSLLQQIKVNVSQ